MLCLFPHFNSCTSILATHHHQAAARAEAEKQRLADAAAQRDAEAAQLAREQEATAAAKARHAAAVKSFFDEQVGFQERQTRNPLFGCLLWRTAVECTPFARQTDSPALLALLRWQMQQVLLQVQEVRELRQRERENQQRDNALLRHRLAEEAHREAEAKVPHLFSNACCCDDA